MLEVKKEENKVCKSPKIINGKEGEHGGPEGWKELSENRMN